MFYVKEMESIKQKKEIVHIIHFTSRHSHVNRMS